MRGRTSVLALLVLAVVPLAYLAALGAGAVSLIGYETRTARQEGFSRTSWFPLRLSVPVWLNSGDAIRADFDVEASFGAVILSVAPPLILKTSLQTASAYVEGKRTGSVLFVAQSPGWYTFYAEPTANGGPHCRGRDTSLFDFFIGSSDCPTFDVSYSVKWRLADARHAAGATAHLHIPRPHEILVTTRIR